MFAQTVTKNKLLIFLVMFVFTFNVSYYFEHEVIIKYFEKKKYIQIACGLFLFKKCYLLYPLFCNFVKYC